MHMFNNSGQSCNAPSRMIVPLSKMKEVAAIAKSVAEKTKAGDPRGEGTTIGPVVNRGQWDKIQTLIHKGIEEGATLVAGGPGLPNDRSAPLGGYKQCGNGREWGKYGLEEYLEVKAVAGYNAA